MELNHLDKNGNAVMVDVSGKEPLLRTAVATGIIIMQPATVARIIANDLKKGDVFACARIAGIMAAKQTAVLIPLCHNLPLDRVTVDLEPAHDRVVLRATVVCVGRTGVEMEALTAVSVAALTIYDMCKAVDSTMMITDLRLVGKKKEQLP